MQVKVWYAPQYNSFDDNFRPIAPPTSHKWCIQISKSPCHGYITKLPTKPTKRQLRKIIKGYLHATK